VVCSGVLTVLAYQPNTCTQITNQHIAIVNRVATLVPKRLEALKRQHTSALLQSLSLYAVVLCLEDNKVHDFLHHSVNQCQKGIILDFCSFTMKT